MKPNGHKYHLLVLTEKSVRVNIDGSNVTNKEEQKLVSINFDSSLSFEVALEISVKAQVKNYMP